MHAAVSRQDVACVDILDLGKPHKAKIPQPVPMSCSRKEEAPKVHPRLSVPISKDFCIVMSFAMQMCGLESIHQSSFEGETSTLQRDGKLEALQVSLFHQEPA